VDALDTGFSSSDWFQSLQGMMAKEVMEPLTVVKHFDPFKDDGSGFSPRGAQAAMHQFAFEAAPEVFHDGVVVAVAGWLATGRVTPTVEDSCCDPPA